MNLGKYSVLRFTLKITKKTRKTFYAYKKSLLLKNVSLNNKIIPKYSKSQAVFSKIYIYIYSNKHLNLKNNILYNKNNKKPTSATTISHVNKPWSPVYSGEYIAIF